MTSAMKLRNELYTDTWYCLSPHGSSLKLTVTVLFPSQFLKAIFSIVLYIIITVKKFVKRLLFIFFGFLTPVICGTLPRIAATTVVMIISGTI